MTAETKRDSDDSASKKSKKCNKTKETKQSGLKKQIGEVPVSSEALKTKQSKARQSSKRDLKREEDSGDSREETPVRDLKKSGSKKLLKKEGSLRLSALAESAGQKKKDKSFNKSLKSTKLDQSSSSIVSRENNSATGTTSMAVSKATQKKDSKKKKEDSSHRELKKAGSRKKLLKKEESLRMSSLMAFDEDRTWKTPWSKSKGADPQLSGSSMAPTVCSNDTDGNNSVASGNQSASGLPKVTPGEFFHGMDSFFDLDEKELGADFQMSYTSAGGTDSPRRELRRLLNVNPSTEMDQFDDKRVLELIQSDPTLCTKRYSYIHFSGKVFPLSILCALGASVATFKACYKAKPDAVARVDDFVGNALHYACAHGASPRTEKTVLFLLTEQPELASATNIMRQYPLHLACKSRASFAVVNALMKIHPMAVQAEDKEGMLPFHLACEARAAYEIIVKLIKAYPLAWRARTKHGDTPLHLAVSNTESTFPVIKALVESHPPSLQVKNNEGLLPFHVALQAGVEGLVLRFLAKHYAAALDVKSNEGETSHDMASRIGYDLEAALAVAGTA